MTPQEHGAFVVAFALRKYAESKFRVSRAWTPAAMMRAAAQYTGKTFAPRAYLAAAAELQRQIETGELSRKTSV